MRILIRNGRVLDASDSNRIDAVTDILVEDGRIVKCDAGLQAEAETTVIDASGCWVTPGLIDIHVHLRDPGFTHKEDIVTGTRSAAAGGFTTICAMPNTNPVTDNPETVSYILGKAKKEGVINVVPCGSITEGQAGEVLADIEGMVKAGVGALSEDGKTVANAQLMKEALSICSELDIAVLSHCEDVQLVNHGQMNEGEAARRLGIPGISNDMEDVIISRDIILAAATGTRLHICHLSTRGGVELVREARAKGLHVTAEAAPHHFLLCDEDLAAAPEDGRVNYKMNPPLRSREDVEAIRQGLQDGTIGVIATDHAPHHADEKNISFGRAANGIIGMETAVPLGITHLVGGGILTPLEFIGKMTVNPAQVLGLDKGTLMVGGIADITIIDPDEEYVIDASSFLSKARNCPFDGMTVKGRVKYTIVNGEIVYSV